MLGDRTERKEESGGDKKPLDRVLMLREEDNMSKSRMDPWGYLVAAWTAEAEVLLERGGPVQVRHSAGPGLVRWRAEEALTFFVRLAEVSAGCR